MKTFMICFCSDKVWSTSRENCQDRLRKEVSLNNNKRKYSDYNSNNKKLLKIKAF